MEIWVGVNAILHSGILNEAETEQVNCCAQERKGGKSKNSLGVDIISSVQEITAC